MSVNTSKDEDEGRKWKDRFESADKVRKRLRAGWRYDPAILNQYFQSVYNNWKVYTGPRTPKQVLKLQSLYKQAIYGDNNDLPPENLQTTEGLKWEAWRKLKGMPTEMAKRRFITFVMEIDPNLIDVMPDERPPIGFPLDRKGNPICAKCNTIVGCSRPILDQRKMNLRVQLFEHEEFHEAEKLKSWIRNALTNQRCVWGVHQPITRAEAKPFMDWFERDENRGFFPYDSISLMEIVKDLVDHYYEVAYEMMMHKSEVDSHQYNETAARVLKIKAIYEEFSGEKYIFEVFCTRDNESCNMKRIADGGRNHKHEVQIDPPTYSDANTMEEAIKLRLQCQQLGLSPCTGVVKDMEERCNIYRERIAAHLEALRKSHEAKARNDSRAEVHKKEKEQVMKLSKDMLQSQMYDACDNNQVEHVRTLIGRGAKVNEESSRGITPLICMVLNEAPGDKVEDLVKSKADMNAPNKNGLTAFMYAARLRDVRTVHVFMKKNANVLTKGAHNYTVLHHCVVHHSEEIVKVLVDYLKEGVGDSMRVVRFLDAVDEDGSTALILAAAVRNTLMCHVLLNLGANPNVRNSVGRTALAVARNNGFSELADWLEKKVAAGAMKVETYADIQFEKQARFGFLKTRDLLLEFGKVYLSIVQKTPSQFHPFICPVYSRALNAKEMQLFIDNHHRYFLQRGIEHYPAGLYDLKHVPSAEEQADKKPLLARLKELMDEMCRLIRQGYTYPNTECGAQPIALTPLMCAVLLSDIRSIRLLQREGTGVVYCNRDGITALMLAAELHDTDVLIELLRHSGDLTAVDNQGYNILAYAGALPLPTYMNKTVVEVLLEDEIMGVKYLNAVDILKLAEAYSFEELKDVSEKNKIAASPKSVERHALFMSLLAQHGLSNMASATNIHHHLKTISHRLINNAEASSTVSTGAKGDGSRQKQLLEEEEDEGELSEFELRAKQLYEEDLERKRKQEEERRAAQASEPPRCPLCTLNIPCAHFLKVESLEKYLNKQISEAAAEAEAEGKDPKKKYVPNKKLKVKNRVKELLEETGLDDRHTDRSILLAQKFMQKEVEIWQNSAQRMLLQNGSQQMMVDYGDGSSYDALEEEQRGALLLNNLDTNEESHFVAEDDRRGSPPQLPADVPDVAIFDANGTENRTNQEYEGIVEPAGNMDSLVVFEPSTGDDALTSSTALVLLDNPVIEQEQSNSSAVVEFHANDDFQSDISTALVVAADVQEEDPTSTIRAVSRKTRRVQFLLPDAEDENRLVVVPTDSSHDFSALSEDITHDSLEAFIEEAKDESGLGSSAALSREETAETSAKSELNESADTQTLIHTVTTTEETKAVEKSLQNSSSDVKEAVKKLQSGELTAVKLSNVLDFKPRNIMLYSSRPIYFPTQSILFNLQKVSLSAWLYIHLCPIQADICPTFPSIALSLHAYFCLLSYIQCEYDDYYKKEYMLQSLVSISDWKTNCGRCSLCFVGFARYKGKESDAAQDNGDHSLCVMCSVKKRLHGKISLAIPRMMRKNFPTSWPVKGAESSAGDTGKKKKSSVASDSAGQMIAVENQLANLEFRKDLSTPLLSLSLNVLDMQESELDDSDAHSGIMSLLTESDANTFASLSSSGTTLVASNIFTRPKELQLLAYHIYKQCWDDAERTVRVCLNRFSINEGEGMLYALNLFSLVADMYKTTGLFVLAQSMYLDMIDMAVPLLGFHNYFVQKTIGQLVVFYYTFYTSTDAESYVKNLREKIQQGVKHDKTKEDLLEALKTTLKKAKDSMVRVNSCYMRFIKPLYGGQNPLSLHSRFMNSLGLSAIYTLFASRVPVMQVARRLFIQYIQAACADLLPIVDFIDLCFRWRVCYDDELRKFLVQHILHRHLSKPDIYVTLGLPYKVDYEEAPENRYRKQSNKHHKEQLRNPYVFAIKQHLAAGEDFNISVLDDVLFKALLRVHPYYVPFLFNDNLWQQAQLEAEEEVLVLKGETYDLCATIMQTLVRHFLARRRVRQVREIAAKLRLQKEMEEKQQHDEEEHVSSFSRRKQRL